MHTDNKQLATLIKALEDIQASDIIVLDVREQTTITDFMIICSGRASRHVKAIADHIMPIMKEVGLPTLHLSGLESGEWVLVDLGDFVIHVMQPDCRSFYNLEALWQDNSTKNDKDA
ncbi:MAG: ribosome silencing factor [Legionellaceae bacterium]|nr:ribosome silencing factor [Legionellaceae bacterium]